MRACIKDLVKDKMAEENLFKMMATGPDSRFIKQKGTEEEGCYYVGIASSTSIDRDNEVMSKSVLNKAQFDLVGKPVLLNHKHDALGVGKITESWLEGDNLMIKMKPTEAKSMQDAVTQIDEGILSAFSVGGKALTKVPSSDGSHKIIKDAEFYEVSVVTIPANADARILGAVAKGLDLEKARIAGCYSDDPKVAEGDGGELEEKVPIVPPVKKPAKDGEEMQDDIHDEARKKGKKKGSAFSESNGGSMTEEKEVAASAESKSAEVSLVKENGPVTPNQPTAVQEPEAIVRFKNDVMRAIEALVGGMGAVSVNTRGAPKQASADVELQKEVSELKSQLSELKASLSKKQSLALQPEPVKVDEKSNPVLFKGAYKTV